jgi:hypothetical protein
MKLAIAIVISVLSTLPAFTGLLPAAAQSEAAQSEAAPTPLETVERLQADLQFAVCRNDWQQAIEVINPLIGSDAISPAYREQLVRFRDRLQDWRSRGARFANLPNCGSTAAPQTAAAGFATTAPTADPAAAPTAAPLPAPPLLPLTALSPATAIDLTTGSGTVAGAVSTGQQIYSFTATAGTQVTLDVNVTRVLPGQVFTDDDSQLFLFDSAGRLLAENDDEGGSYQSRIGSVTIPSDGTYFVVVTTFNNDPVFDGNAIVTGWEGDGSSSIEYDLTITGSPSR